MSVRLYRGVHPRVWPAFATMAADKGGFSRRSSAKLWHWLSTAEWHLGTDDWRRVTS